MLVRQAQVGEMRVPTEASRPAAVQYSLCYLSVNVRFRSSLVPGIILLFYFSLVSRYAILESTRLSQSCKTSTPLKSVGNKFLL